MITYPGGTHDNHFATKYIFHENYFSDLGRATTFLGESNLPSHILFTSALTLVGLALICFFCIFPIFFTSSKIAKILTIIGTINGIFTAVFYIGIGFTPYDVYGYMHSFFVHAAFLSSIVTITLYMIAIFLEKEYPNLFGWIAVVFLVLLVGYIYILFNGPGVDSVSSFNIQSVGQKIIVYSEIIFFAVQAFGSLRIVSRENDYRIQHNQKLKETTKDLNGNNQQQEEYN